jgi:rhodanese-related sulfurtransferase
MLRRYPLIENVSPADVWEALQRDPNAYLIDVRTNAEWNFVGMPDLSAVAKEPVLIQWQVFPAMQVNADFVTELRQAGFTPDDNLYFLCRSGVRSQAAGAAAQAAGFKHSYNIADGFEGPPDGAGHRGARAGWKASGLPWRQG